MALEEAKEAVKTLEVVDAKLVDITSVREGGGSNTGQKWEWSRVQGTAGGRNQDQT